jgi:hypothetical protein
MTNDQKKEITLNSLKIAKEHLETAAALLQNTYLEISKYSVVAYTMNNHTISEITKEIERVEEICA